MKISQKHKNILLYSLWSIFYTFAFNYHLILQRVLPFRDNNISFYSILFQEIIISTLLSFIVLFAFSFNKKFFIFFNLLVTIITTSINYFIINYKIIIDHNLLATVLDSDKREILEFLDLNLVIFCLTASVIAFIIISHINIKKSFIISFISCLSFLLLSFLNGARVNYKYFPLNLVKTTYDYLEHKTTKSLVNLTDYNFDTFPKDENLFVIMIVGESARADRLSLNAYHRDTNPFLKNIPNLINFHDFHSFANITRKAVPRMLSTITSNETNPNFSIIDVFNSIGFNTSWFGAQGNSSFNRVYLRLARSSKYSVFLNDALPSKAQNDLNLIPYVKKYIDSTTGNNFLVIHTIGSHWYYDNRVTEKFKKYKPLCSDESSNISMTSCSPEALSNSYDNTILQTDYFLAQIIDLFHEKNAFIVYTSDHGESLGEKGIYSHGIKDAPEQFHVASMAWASDTFIELHKEKFLSLKHFQTKPLNHDFLFHSLLDCINVESNIINKELSFCTKKIN